MASLPYRSLSGPFFIIIFKCINGLGGFIVIVNKNIFLHVLQGGGGLSSLLPQPKNLVVKETERPLLPHTLTKRPGSDKPKATPAKSQGLSGTSPSPSAIKAAAKSAAMQLAKQMAADEEGSDDELAPENYFSLPESSAAQPVMPQNPHSQQYVPSLHPPPSSVEDAPLDFVSNADSYSKSVGAMQDYQTGEYQQQYQEYPEIPLPETSPQVKHVIINKPRTPVCSLSCEQLMFYAYVCQDYYGEGYYQGPNPAADEQEDSGSSSMFNDEAVSCL